jgi:hypothetical protein
VPMDHVPPVRSMRMPLWNDEGLRYRRTRNGASRRRDVAPRARRRPGALGGCLRLC